MSVFDIFAKFVVDTSGLEEGLTSAKSLASKAGGAIGGALKTAAKVGTVAITAATGAVTAFSKKAIDAGQDFDAAMSQVAATMGKTMEEMQYEVGETDTSFGHFSGTLRDFAQYMGSNTAFSATQAAEALNYMALAGYNAQQSMDMLPNVLSLAAAGGMDLARASDMVTDAQTALGLSFEETNTLVDQMAKTASTTNTSVEQLGDAILTIGGTAQFMEGGIDELNQVLGLLADNGIKGSEAGTHLRNMLLKLSAPTKDGADLLASFAETLGHDLVFDKATGEMRAFSDIFADLNTVMENFTEQDKIQAFSDLFNTRDVASATALLNTTADRWNEVADAIDNAQGSAAQMAETQLDNLAGDITLFKSALEGAYIVASDQLTPSIRDFVKIGTTGLSNITQAFKEDGLSGAMGALGTMISEGLNKIVEGLPQAIEAGGQLLSAIGQGIVDNIDVLLASAETIITMFVERISEAAGSEESKFSEVATKILTFIGEMLMQNGPVLLDSALQLIVNLANYLIEGIPQAIPKLIELIEKIGEVLMENAPLLIDAAFTLIFELGMGIAKAIPKLVPTIIDIVIAIVDKLTEPKNLEMLIRAALEIMLALFEGLVTAIPRVVAAIPKIISNLVGALIANIPNILAAGIRLIASLASSIVQAIPIVVAAIPGLIFALVGGITQGIKQIAEVGMQIVEGLWEGIKGSWNNLVNNFKNLASGLVDGIKGMFGIHSPSIVFEGIGKNLDAGLAIGITQNMDDVDDAFSDLEKYTEIAPSVSLQAQGGPKNSGMGKYSSELYEGLVEAFKGLTLEVFIGQERLDGLVTQAIQRTNYRSGGR